MKKLVFLLLFAASEIVFARTASFRAEIPNVPLVREAAYWVSEWRTVEIPAGLASFQIVVTGSADSIVQITDLVAPDGTRFVRSINGENEVLNPYSQPVLLNVASSERSEGVMPGTGTLIVPNNPELGAPAPGLWRFRSHSRKEPSLKTVSFTFIGKNREDLAKNILPLRVFVAKDSYWTGGDRRVEKLLAKTKEIYATYGIELSVTAVTLLENPILTPLALPADVTALAMANNDSRAINAYLLPKMEYQNKPINGLACLGGPIGLAEAHGCSVSMYAAEKADDVTLDQQGKILVHEIGHYLGLFHTRDDGYFHIGTVFDKLDDTPQEITGSNLMDPGIHDAHPTFSKEQLEMLRLSPIFQ